MVGAIAPIGVWLMGRRTKKNLWRKVNLPVLFGSLSWIPSAVWLVIVLTLVRISVLTVTPI